MTEVFLYIELKRRGHDIKVGTIKGLEIGFIAEKDGVTEYYQVAKSTAQTEMYEREITPFLLIRDNYRKLLLTEDRGSFDDRGIEQYTIIE